MIFRLSQKLNAKIKAGTLPALPLDEKWARAVERLRRMQSGGNVTTSTSPRKDRAS